MAEEYLYKVLISKLLPPGGYTKNELLEVVCNKINIPYCVISPDFETALKLLVEEKLLQVNANRYYKTKFCEDLAHSNYSLSLVIQNIHKMYAQKLPNFSTDMAKTNQQNDFGEYGMCPPVVMKEGFLNVIFPDELEESDDDISCEPPRKKLHLDPFDQPSSSNNCGFRQNIMDTSEADIISYPNTSTNSFFSSPSGSGYQGQDPDSEDYEPAAKRPMLDKPPFK
ncbi:uncharacterized protein LOC119689014 [Teleopsis dalmanni]|uniref:uncharacterized protein LOC119689014 n=1 Tax=Teleopsis dalmanni TaxID=139649 RepID=UPI0018CD967C|nr:uncharacterized protein LOC119689014 [Teleopsis dalmanni]XP_037959675.1 uncharacterized protein LOC119689014 [Teleopsis dalmanni]